MPVLRVKERSNTGWKISISTGKATGTDRLHRSLSEGVLHHRATQRFSAASATPKLLPMPAPMLSAKLWLAELQASPQSSSIWRAALQREFLRSGRRARSGHSVACVATPRQVCNYSGASGSVVARSDGDSAPNLGVCQRDVCRGDIV